MRSVLIWFGVVLYVCGVMLVLAKLVMSYRGFSVGTQAQQVLADSIWHLGPVMVVLGAALVALWRRLSGTTNQG